MIDEIQKILFDKLEEMAEIDFYDCANGEYPQICEAMNNIANTLIQIEEGQK